MNEHQEPTNSGQARTEENKQPNTLKEELLLFQSNPTHRIRNHQLIIEKLIVVDIRRIIVLFVILDSELQGCFVLCPFQRRQRSKRPALSPHDQLTQQV